MLRTKRARRLLAVLLFLIAPSLASGCITASMWDGVDGRGERAAAIALTPVTFALDATLFAGWIWLECADEGSGCHPCHPRCR
jgi:hypothetical protein